MISLHILMEHWLKRWLSEWRNDLMSVWIIDLDKKETECKKERDDRKWEKSNKEWNIDKEWNDNRRRKRNKRKKKRLAFNSHNQGVLPILTLPHPSSLFPHPASYCLTPTTLPPAFNCSFKSFIPASPIVSHSSSLLDIPYKPLHLSLTNFSKPRLA